MTPLDNLVPYAKALRIALAAARPVMETETLALAAGLGRVAAEEIRAAEAIPQTPRAAMDGYALRAADTARAPARLAVRGFRPAGTDVPVGIPRGTCVEIATGAVVPAGCDAVVEVERTRRAGDDIVLADPVEPGRNVIPAGDDVPAGGLIVPAGAVLTPGRLGAVAATGRARVAVLRRPKLAILTTGDEVKPPGAPLAPHEVYDANAAILAGLAAACGCAVREAVHAPDDPARIDAALAALLPENDVVVFTGGSSVGARDFTAAACAARGEVLFHGVAVKPGRPTLLARMGRTLVFGMPGYPASCLLMGEALLAPVLERLAGRPAEGRAHAPARLSRDVRSALGRRDFLTVRLSGDAAEPVFRGSHAVGSVAAADGYVVIPEEADRLAAGAAVEVCFFRT